MIFVLLKHILYILLVLILPVGLFAGNNDKTKPSAKSVSGKVVSVNGEEIAGTKITIKETNETFYADLDGNFKFQLKTDKVYSVTIESIGYEPKEVKSNELSLFSDISLKEL